MENVLKRKVTIETDNEADTLTIGSYIHDQLVENVDYKGSNIVLRVFENQNKVELLIFKECDYIPEIRI